MSYWIDHLTDDRGAEEQPTKECLNPVCFNETTTVYCSSACGGAHQDMVRKEVGY